mmetsp:Transcript_39848/g.80327  ORF Transcript_39848/g.80327 Transcript_39848/m.80327 type:complete len:211 (-) Transcript_39848:29-661(-)
MRADGEISLSGFSVVLAIRVRGFRGCSSAEMCGGALFVREQLRVVFIVNPPVLDVDGLAHHLLDLLGAEGFAVCRHHLLQLISLQVTFLVGVESLKCCENFVLGIPLVAHRLLCQQPHCQHLELLINNISGRLLFFNLQDPALQLLFCGKHGQRTENRPNLPLINGIFAFTVENRKSIADLFLQFQVWIFRCLHCHGCSTIAAFPTSFER